MHIQNTNPSSAVQPGARATRYLAPARRLRNHLLVLLCGLWGSAPVWATDDLAKVHAPVVAIQAPAESNKHMDAAADAPAQALNANEPHGAAQLFGSDLSQREIVLKPLEAIRFLTSSAVASANSVASAAASVASVASSTMLDVAEVIQQGIASWYGAELHNRRTANGERFNMNDLTAAHRTLPFGTRLCAHSPKTGKSVIVRINDRGPFAKDRIIDFSKAAAQALGIVHSRPDVVALLDSSDQRCAMG